MDEPLADWYDIEPHSNIAIGDNAYVSGDAETVSGVSSIAIGDEASVNGNYSVSIGLESFARNDSVAIGEHASAGDYSVGIGSYAGGSGLHSIAIGDSAYTQSDYSIALGTCSSTSGDNAIAIGKDVDVSGDNSVALGTNAYVHYNITNAVALGADSSAVDSNVLSIGKAAVGTEGQDGYVPEYTRKIQHVTAGTADTDAVNVKQLNTAIANVGGGSSSGSNVEFVSTGNDYWIPNFDYSSLSNEQKRVYDAYNVQTQADYDALRQDDDKINRTGQGAVGNNSIAIGLLAKANTLSDIAIGDMATTGTGYGGSNIAIGKLAYAESDYAFNTAIGYKSEARGGTSIAIGDGAKTIGPASVTIGSQSTTEKSYSVTIGSDAHSTEYNSVTIGDRAINTASQSVAVGMCSMVVTPANCSTSISLGTAVGPYAKVNASIAEAFGYNASANLPNSTAVGNNSMSAGCLAAAFGYYSHAVAEGATAIGPSTFAMGCYSTAVGAYSYANAKNSVSIGTGSGSFGSNYGAKSPYSIAIGSGTTASGVSGTGDNIVGDSIVIGRQSNAGDTGDNLVIGLNSSANAGGSRVIGSYSTANGSDGLVFGSYSYANNNQSIAIGKQVSVSGDYSIAIGSNANVQSSSSNSIALGTNSVAKESNVLSLGKDAVGTEGESGYTSEITRKIQHVTAGTADTDAVNLKQLNDAIAQTTTLDGLAVKYDSTTKEMATFSGTQGTKLSNLKAGAVSATSMDAINGSQLFAVKQDIAGFATDIARNSASGLLVDTMDASKADASLNNLTESGKRVLKQYAENAVQEYMATQQGTNSAPMAPMAVSNTNRNTLAVTNAGNGSLHVGEGSYVNGTSSIAIGVGNQVNANNSGAFGDPSIINADASYVLGNDDTINTGATGSFIVGNDGVSDAKGGLLFGSNTKATQDAIDGVAIGNSTEVLAKNAIALGSGSIADTENTLSIGSSTLKRKIVNVADGSISQNSSEVVTGAQLYVTNEKVQKNTEALEKKADVDASNINTADWSQKLGIGQVKAGNSNLVTGGTVYDAIKDIGNNQLIQTNGDAITIGANSNASTINVASYSGQGRAITGVVTDANDMSSAANVGYVNQVGQDILQATNGALQRVDNKVNKVGANAAAMANLPTPTFDGDEKWAFAAGVGHYQGETAGAVGAFYKPNDNVIARVSGSFGNGDEMVGAGVAVSLNKANTPVVSKAQLLRKINAMEQDRQADKAEIAQLKALVGALMEKVEKLS